MPQVEGVNQQKMSYFAAVLLSINIMVGAGILYAVGPMTASAGSSSFLGWPLIGLLVFPVIWGISKASQLFPGEGGFYHYCSTGWNPTAGFIAHWGYILGYMGTAASLLTLLRDTLIASLNIDLFIHYPVFLNVILVGFYTLIHFISLEKINKIQSIATLLKIAPIVSVIVLLLFYFNTDITMDVSGLKNIGMTVSTVIFAYTGFEACCSIGGLLRDGPQKVGSVILTGFFATLALYFFFHIGLVHIMGPENLATYGAIAFPQFLGLTPQATNAVQAAISIVILLIWANSILGVSLANITNIQSMADRSLIPGDRLLSTLNKNQRPIYAALLHGLFFFSLVTFITNVDILFALTNLGVNTAFIITLCAVFRTHLAQKNYLQLFVTLLAFGSCSIFIYYSIIKIPSLVYTLPLAIAMAVGIVLFNRKQSCKLKEAA